MTNTTKKVIQKSAKSSTFSNEERAAIARTGQERTIREHLFTERMRELLEILLRKLHRECSDSSFSPRGTEITLTTPA